MTRQFDNYQRLARGLLSCSSLWVSKANVLYVCGSGLLVPFAEEYHRFDLRRIQSISVVRTYTGLVLNVIFGVVALGAGGLGAVALFNAADADPFEGLFNFVGVPSVALGALALGLLIGNLALGPTCQFQIQTTARLQKIRPVRRLRVGRRVLAELAPLLVQAQSASTGTPASVAPAAPLPEPLAVEPTPG